MRTRTSSVVRTRASRCPTHDTGSGEKKREKHDASIKRHLEEISRDTKVNTEKNRTIQKKGANTLKEEKRRFMIEEKLEIALRHFIYLVGALLEAS